MLTKVIITIIEVIGIRLSKKAERVCDALSEVFPFKSQINICMTRKFRILLDTVKMTRFFGKKDSEKKYVV